MTLCGFRRMVRSLMICALVASLGVPPAVSAQTHVVSPAALHTELVAAARVRQQDRSAVLALLSSPMAEKALETARLDLMQLKAAVSSLNDEELARLAARSRDVQSDFEAGRLTDRDLLLILIGLAALILIIVAVR